MAERRPLVAGLQPTEAKPEVEQQFVYGSEKKPQEAEPAQQVPTRGVLPQMSSRTPITTRARPEIASALKRASLERQLAGEEPYYVQDILEEALSAWLKAQGYLTDS